MFRFWIPAQKLNRIISGRVKYVIYGMKQHCGDMPYVRTYVYNTSARGWSVCTKRYENHRTRVWKENNTTRFLFCHVLCATRTARVGRRGNVSRYRNDYYHIKIVWNNNVCNGARTLKYTATNSKRAFGRPFENDSITRPKAV